MGYQIHDTRIIAQHDTFVNISTKLDIDTLSTETFFCGLCRFLPNYSSVYIHIVPEILILRKNKYMIYFVFIIGQFPPNVNRSI